MRLDWPEHRVGVQLALEPLERDAVIVTRDGGEIRLEQVALTVWSVELERCDRSPNPMIGALWPRIARAFDNRAWAHGEAAPNVISEPKVVLAAPSDGHHVDLGTMSPPADQYCSINILLKRADDDARRMQEAPAMQDRTALARGSWRAEDGTWSPFEMSSSKTLQRRIDLDQPLVLGDDTDVERTFVIDLYPSAWFESVDVEASEDEAMSTVLSNIRSSLSLGETP